MYAVPQSRVFEVGETVVMTRVDSTGLEWTSNPLTVFHREEALEMEESITRTKEYVYELTDQNSRHWVSHGTTLRGTPKHLNFRSEI